MLFDLLLMCKSKRQLRKDVIEPATMPRQSSSWRSNRTSHKSSSSAEPSTSISNYNDSIPSTGSSYYNPDSWITASHSSSGKPSITQLRDNLPEKPHVYPLSEISAATNNFTLKPFSSSSSSSTSWRCAIRDQNVVLIQRKFRRPMNVSELVDRLAIICRSHHSSLIKLKGASISGNYIYLIYDYIQGANLADCLRNPKNPHFTVLSNWMSRVKIAGDIAHGLDYIHHSTGLAFSFVHNHIKASSIIITPNLDAKICHFGAAELCGEITMDVNDNDKLGSKGKSKMEYKRSGSGQMKLEGTRGYMAPEFRETGATTEKSDVYALGVVIFELISGREPLKYRFDEERRGYVRDSVIEAAKEAVEEGVGGVRKWVDKRMKDSYPVEVVAKLTSFALECVVDDPEKRPDMGRVCNCISQLYLESQTWVEKMGGLPTDFSVSLAPR